MLLWLAVTVLGCAQADGAKQTVSKNVPSITLPALPGQDDVDSFFGKANASGKLNTAWDAVKRGESVPAAIKDADIGGNAGEAARTLTEAASVQRAFDKIVGDVVKARPVQPPVNPEVQAVVCFAVGSVIAHNRLPTGEEYERFSVTAKVQQVTGLKQEVERTQSFLDLVAKIKNNTPDRVAFKLGMKLVCGVLLGQ